jgi:hypothetical protein
VGLLLGELSLRHGRQRIKEQVKEVEAKPEQVVDEALSPYKLAEFVRSLGIKPSESGDHW